MVSVDFSILGAGKKWAPGYVELPYTLPQVSPCSFCCEGQLTSGRKLDWIAERGGMALLIVHPVTCVWRRLSNPAYLSGDPV
jgi:hypothetical protein